MNTYFDPRRLHVVCEVCWTVCEWMYSLPRDQSAEAHYDSFYRCQKCKRVKKVGSSRVDFLDDNMVAAQRRGPRRERKK